MSNVSSQPLSQISKYCEVRSKLSKLKAHIIFSKVVILWLNEMSVREEDRKKSNSTSRGLGLAAAAIGVGVGAALYYYFSKGPENPGGEGSTTGWNSEQDHTLLSSPDNEDSYTTISEDYTTDTSIHSSHSDIELSESVSEVSSREEWFPLSDEVEITDNSDDSSESDTIDHEVEDNYNENSDEYDVIHYSNLPVLHENSFDSEMGDWDVTNSSVGVPEDSTVTLSPLFRNLHNIVSPIWTHSREISNAERQERFRKSKVFRERTWSLEECSICFEVILKDQQVTTLPCTHHFHTACITPWLQEQQTCPNCRKTAE